MKIFTVTSGGAAPGASITPKSAQIPYARLCVGEQGRGRKEAWLPLAEADICSGVKNKIISADVIVTQKGTTLLVEEKQPSGDCLVVLAVEAGFRGSCGYSTYSPQPCTFERIIEKCSIEACPGRFCSHEKIPACKTCRQEPQPGHLRDWQPGVASLIAGEVAQGAAGRMGGHHEYVCVLKRGTLIRANRGGRLYGAPATLYIHWDGDKLTVTAENPFSETALLSELEAL